MQTTVKLLGVANVDHSQIIGGMQSNYKGGYIPPSPLVSAPLSERHGTWFQNGKGRDETVLKELKLYGWLADIQTELRKL